MDRVQYQGGCFCGSIRYRVSNDVKNPCVCHCQSCRRASGAPFVAWLTCAQSDFELITGKLTICHSSPHVTRGFCGTCGTTLTYAHESRASELDVSLATLDDASAVEPIMHIWTGDKLPWVTLQDKLPQYAGWASNG